ncbi:PaaI family thioesterase [Mycolicibacterium pulveris]|uniref:Phenylacetic acid degradation protein n=1 Tax=Mycolicibacterium pulveris TaxID=36813 RepID=A0A7I7UJW7_MYCPV|nr:PaaI family thioesterase [Mycolicibacterium pulveris]MCV6979595.1 PaaI family thioesterase [Mycolicibacterium pulveris]BBY80959.1 phenylacetic acid degradation protein [Mycolicibacterium pulveris]
MSYPLCTPLGRFGVVTREEGPHRCVASIPVGGAVNPLTAAPTIAPLAMLVDHVGGLVNHHRREADEWTVTSELSLELIPEAVDVVASAPDVPVVATARPFGPKDEVALGLCEFTHRDVVLATATVRSFFIRAAGRVSKFPDGPTGPPPPVPLAEKMAVTVAEGGGAGQVLAQASDPVLNNSLGIVHGGVSAMALEMVASAALNASRPHEPLRTASLRVNFLREFRSGAQSRYVGTTLRVGRRTGVAEAQALHADGPPAIIARVTAYR